MHFLRPGKNQSPKSQSYLSFVTLLVVFCLVASVVCGQQFYPNGRYGRRDSMPSIHEISGNRELTVAFFGDGSVQCQYTGYSDYYRCSRKLESKAPSPVVPNDSD